MLKVIKRKNVECLFGLGPGPLPWHLNDSKILGHLSWRGNSVQYDNKRNILFSAGRDVLHIKPYSYFLVCKENHILIWAANNYFYLFNIDKLEVISAENPLQELDASGAVAVAKTCAQMPLFIVDAKQFDNNNEIQFHALWNNEDFGNERVVNGLHVLPQEILYILNNRIYRILPHKNLVESIYLSWIKEYVDAANDEWLTAAVRDPETQEIYLTGWRTPNFVLDPYTYALKGTFTSEYRSPLGV